MEHGTLSSDNAQDSGIENDPNDWAQGVGRFCYILELLLSINVSVQTVGIVNNLPKVKFE